MGLTVRPEPGDLTAPMVRMVLMGIAPASGHIAARIQEATAVTQGTAATVK